MSEFGFIETLRQSFEGIGDSGIVGIGDDCAVMPLSKSSSLVVSTDMLTEGVHFLLEATSARELGAKSLAVNLSDIAAMGAVPVASFLSIALPKACREVWLAEFMEGYRDTSARYNVRLAGGDTTASAGGVTINVGVIGKAPSSHLKYRNGARVGDVVVVNGRLGESAAGLADILNGETGTPAAETHRNPVPQVFEGAWLGSRAEVHSMIDLSDGVASDLRHILRSSGVGASVDLATIPTDYSLELALGGGEDYKLLFTVAPADFDRLRKAYLRRFGSSLYPIGVITEGDPEIIWTREGQPVDMNISGFTHF
ncbi:MAG: thiamine-phosphate kinase [Rikenellaceae bacterium]|jgi:thiamine-monophosphate kinase|nr:thiamine-phosphate kinase [Rikenellaceae bacterium]